MCSDPDSHPPIDPADHSSASGHEIGLIVGDGSRCTAYQADAARPTGVGMIVLPDYNGLTGFYQELALRFAEDGIDAVAIDYYDRMAGPPPRDASFEPQRHARQTKWTELQADVAAAAAHLRMRRHVESLFSIGFCFGGRVSFLLGSLPELRMAGVIGFYGWPVGPFLNDTPAPAAVARKLEAPVLGIFGGADQKIPRPMSSRSEGRSQPPRSSTTSERTRTRRIRSSTAPRQNTPRPRRMHGRPSEASSPPMSDCPPLVDIRASQSEGRGRSAPPSVPAMPSRPASSTGCTRVGRWGPVSVLVRPRVPHASGTSRRRAASVRSVSAWPWWTSWAADRKGR